MSNYYLSEADLSIDQRNLRMNIRNAFLAENVTVLRLEAIRRANEGRWFEVSCLLELACEE